MSSGIPSILALLVSIINIAWTWHAKSQSAAADRVKKIEDRLDLVEDRQLRLEGEFKHLPTKEDISGLKVQLAEVIGLVNRQESEIGSVSRTVRRIDDYLREKA